MFPTKAGEFATAPRQESTVVPHPFRAARRAARARRRPQTGAERSRRFGLLFAKPLQAGNRQGGLTDKTRSLLNVRLYQIVRDRRWRQRFTSPICRKSRPGKSAAGQSRHFGPASLTSGLARIADILRNDRHVRNVPRAVIRKVQQDESPRIGMTRRKSLADDFWLLIGCLCPAIC